MVSNKDRLYVALYPSGVVSNDERKQAIIHDESCLLIPNILVDTTGAF